MRKRPLSLILALCLALFAASDASAYSYGSDEQEPVAAAYTTAVAAANKGDWNGAAAAFAGVQQDVEKDAGGPAATAAWQAAITAKDSALAAQVFRSILYLNLKRRLAYAREEIGVYTKAKVLVNRAIATYEALSPYVKSKEGGLDAAARAQLDQAFDALGNPGVLGVGVKAPQPDRFDAATNELLTRLAPILSIDFAAIAHPASPGGAPTTGATSGTGAGAQPPSNGTSGAGASPTPPPGTTTGAAAPAPPATSGVPQGAAQPASPPTAESQQAPRRTLWYLAGVGGLMLVAALLFVRRGSSR